MMLKCLIICYLLFANFILLNIDELIINKLTER